MKTAAEEIKEMIAELEKKQSELQLMIAETGQKIAELKVKAANLTEDE